MGPTAALELQLQMKTVFLELNEFNFDLLQEAGETLGLKNIQKLTSMHKSDLWTDDVYESDFLEPWVQWVSVHTGLPAKEHQIKHLGDGPKLQASQIWEKLGERGLSSGIWGAMNASRKNTKSCHFFFPDPWTSHENAFPEELNTLLAPLQNTTKNYTSRKKSQFLKKISEVLSFLKKHGLLFKFCRKSLSLVKDWIYYRGKPFVFVSFADELSADLFLKYKARYQPDFSLLFLNSIAHLQHHQWKNRKILKNDPLAHGFQIIDQILGDLFAQMGPEDLLIATNAFSQQNTALDKPWILYRQIDHLKFLNAIGIEGVKVESHMTHDAHLHFQSERERQRGEEVLKQVMVQGSSLFLVESYPDEPKKLFFRIQFTDPLDQGALLLSEGKLYPFFQFFTPIVERTGKHMQQGTLLCNQPKFPEKLANHEISKYLLTLL